jgi:peptide/nickel transport system substrate-binding protein
MCLALVLFAAACGDDASEAGADEDELSAETTTSLAPRSGGTLTFAANSEIRGLDPIVAFGEAIAGGIELHAIYDTLVRWDPETNEYEMGTAESLEPSADGLTWTLKIRSGIQFTDGTPYDAEAVKAALDRTMSAANTTKTRANLAGVESVSVVDPLTVAVKLKSPWPTFPSVLADRPGNIPSPTAVAACGTTPPIQCPFNMAPVGAGPFVVKAFRPGEVLELERNPNYWGQPPYLDAVRVVPGGDSGGQRTLEGLKAGSFDMVHLPDPVAVAEAEEAGLVKVVDNRQAGAFGVLYLNNGLTVTCKDGAPAGPCAGKPDGPVSPPTATSSLKVRQAVAAAIDPEVINDRAWGGKGKPGTALIQEDFRYYPGVEGPKYDVARAQQLVSEAKADGFSGTIRYLCNRELDTFSTAVVTMLQAAGFTVQSDTQGDVNTVAQQYISNKDYDIVCGGLRIGEDDLQWTQSLYSFLGSDSPSNRVGYKNPEMDQAILALRDATTDGQRVEAYRRISELYVRDVPVLSLTARPEVIAASPKVQGLKQTVLGEVLLHEAWISN